MATKARKNVDNLGNSSRAYTSGQKKLYIHYDPFNYDGGLITSKTEKQFLFGVLDSLQKAKSRMIQNLYNISLANLTPGTDAYNIVQSYAENPASQKKLLEQIAYEVQKQYKTALSSGLENYYSGINSLYSDEKETREKGLNQAINGIKEYIGHAMASEEILDLPQIQKLAEIAKQGASVQAIASAIGLASEIPEMLAGLRNAANGVAAQVIKQQLLGTKKTKLGIAISNSNKQSSQTFDVESKAADFVNHIGFKTSGYSQNANFANLQGYVSFDWFGSGKVSKNEKAPSKMVSMGNVRFLTRFVEEYFGFSDDIRYAYYNSMVVGSGKNPILAENSKIIRLALMGDLIDFYLTGANIDQTQLVLIKNGLAYPMISIIEKVISNFSSKLEKMDQNPNLNRIGNLSDGFTVTFEGKAANDWVGEEGKFNKAEAYMRVGQARKAVDSISTRGQVRLDKIFTRDSIQDGIPMI